MKVRDICELINGRAFKPSDWGSEGLPIIRIQNLNDISAPFNYYAGEYSPIHEVNNGELLFSWSGTPGTSFGAFRWYRGKGVLNQHIFRVLPKVKIDKEYLRYTLNGNLNLIIAKAHGGVGLQHITKKELDDIEIPVPGLDKQLLIVGILKRIESLINCRKQQLHYFDSLIKARFVEMFGTFPENPMGWKIGTIRDVVSDVRYGSSRPAVEGGRYPYLRMNNITYTGELDLTDIKQIDVPENELDKCTVRRGDVLFNRTNSKELVGKTCVYDRDETMVLAGFVIRVRLNDLMLPEFLSSFLNTDFSKAMLLGMCKTAIGQANINAQEMQGIRIYIPPIDKQKEFALFKAQIDKSKVVVQAALEKAQLLFDSLMQQYFG